MPPGNSNNKQTVVERCSYCASSSCSGESSHSARNCYQIKNIHRESQESAPDKFNSTAQSEIPIKTRGVSSYSRDDHFPHISINPITASLGASSLTQGNIETNARNPTSTIAQYRNIGLNATAGSASLVSVSISPVSSDSLEPDAYDNSASGESSHVNRIKSDNAVPSSRKASFNREITTQRSELLGPELISSTEDESGVSISKLLKENVTDEEQSISSNDQSKVVLEGFEKGQSVANQNEDECLNSIGNEQGVQNCLRKHSRRANIFEGTVTRFMGPRSAEVRIYDPDGGMKLAQLLVEKFSLCKNNPAYLASVDIKSVLRIGDTIKLICTEHRRKDDTAFHYFAHQAWKADDDIAWKNCANNDAESVNSFASHGSLHDSVKLRGRRSRRQRRGNKVINEQTPIGLGVDICKWLDNSSYLGLNVAPSSAIIEGSEYHGKVMKLLLPYAFLVEIESNQSFHFIFVYSKYFYPEGPHSSNMAQGLSIKGIVNVGEQMIVIPTRSIQHKSSDCEWVARKAWPKGKELSFEVNEKIPEKIPNGYMEPFHPKNSDFVLIKNDQNGVILSLQTDWGLVKDLKNNQVFVFYRQNAYLFGLSLKNFILEDVFREGDLVKFSQVEEDRGVINASVLYHGCQIPDFNSFVQTIHDYCQVRNIKFKVEAELIQLGEVIYSSK